MNQKTFNANADVVVGLFILGAVPGSIIAFLLGFTLQSIYLILLSHFLFVWARTER
jgi:hypothetical protein